MAQEKKLVIVGAGGHGKVVADLAVQLGCYQQILFLDDDMTKKECLGFPIAGNCSKIGNYIETADLFVAIGNARLRQKLVEGFVACHANLPVLVHPSAILGRNVEIGTGSVLMPGTIVNPDCRIGKGCIINTSASIDHDCVVGDFVHIAVGVHLAGNVTIGDRTWIGIGTVVKNGVTIAADCMIGAGAVVVKDLMEEGTYVGIPARKL